MKSKTRLQKTQPADEFFWRTFCNFLAGQSAGSVAAGGKSDWSGRVKVIILAFIMPIILVACAVPQHAATMQIGRAFRQHFVQFEIEALWHGNQLAISDLIVKFGPTDGNQLAYCQTGRNLTPTIVINRMAWNSRDYLQQEMLLFHELGHCVLGRMRHNNARDGLNMPASLMNSYEFGSYYYEARREYYLAELFGHGLLY